jgi:hypothetical protein
MDIPNLDSEENSAADNEIQTLTSEELDFLPSLERDGPISDARENNSGPSNKTPPLSPSVLDNSSIRNSSNVQPTASSSATHSVFSPEIVGPFQRLPKEKEEVAESRSPQFTHTRLKKRQFDKNMKQMKDG